ncbi:WYL domain-containing protein [Streptomonospora algeriensis]|uniref:WYL domain-containing protein n=1 Tax=Streptomonospora algeriensis TaxID=995084 RepID=A0ABW3BBT0_9ACTN
MRPGQPGAGEPDIGAETALGRSAAGARRRCGAFERTRVRRAGPQCRALRTRAPSGEPPADSHLRSRGGPVLAATCFSEHAPGSACRSSPAPHPAEALLPLRRRVEPYRLVASERRWYLLAYDLDRRDWRSFRVDRYPHRARFLVHASAEAVRAQIPVSAAVVQRRGSERCEVRAGPAAVWCRRPRTRGRAGAGSLPEGGPANVCIRRWTACAAEAADESTRGDRADAPVSFDFFV